MESKSIFKGETKYGDVKALIIYLLIFYFVWTFKELSKVYSFI